MYLGVLHLSANGIGEFLALLEEQQLIRGFSIYTFADFWVLNLMKTLRSQRNYVNEILKMS